MRSCAHTALAAGTRRSAARPRLDDKVVQRKFEGRLAVGALGRGGVRLLAHRQQSADVDVGHQIEGRDGLHRLGQARGDGGAHGIERHLFVRDAIEQRLDLRGAGAGRQRTAGSGRGLLDVGGHDAAARPGAFDIRKIDAALAGEPPRQRGDDGAARQLGWTVIALRRAHFAPGTHVGIGERTTVRPLIGARAGIQGCLAPDPRFRGGERSLWRARRGDSLRRRSRRRARRCPAAVVDHRHHGADLGGLADLEADIGQRAGDGRGHFHRGLVGLDLEQVVARLHASPAALNHLTILPSATVSPSCGIRTSIYVPRVT